MPTNDDFEAAISSLQSLPQGASSSRLLCELFPTPDDLHAFQTWLDDRTPSPPALSAPDFISVVDKAHLVQWSDDLSNFVVSAIIHGRKLSIPVGFDSEYVYRLVPNPLGLIPHDRNLSSTTKDARREPLLQRYLLGVNFNVQPWQPKSSASSRTMNMPDESPRSGQSKVESNALIPGFIFFQLGELQAASHGLQSVYSGPEARKTLLEQQDDHSWEPTGFYLVARLGPTGKMAGVYAIYDEFPIHLDTGRREHTRDHNWGVLPRGDADLARDGIGQFSLAKIGQRLGELGYHKRLRLTENLHYPVELVRVKPCIGTLGAVRERVGT
jgi:hypothetical protein